MSAAMQDLARARDALHAIPPDLPRDEWVRAGLAAHAAGLSFADFDAWSAGAENYKAHDATAVWRSHGLSGSRASARSISCAASAISACWNQRILA